MTLSKQEQETIITYNEAEATANVYTHNRALRRRLEKLSDERPVDCHKSREYPDRAVEYIVPKAWVKLTPPRVASDAQKAALVKARAKAAKIRSEP